MIQQYLKAVCYADQQVNPLFCFLNANLTKAENGEAQIVVPNGPHLTQGAGLTAGGILALLADEAMAHAVMSTLKEGESCVTAEMNVRYLSASNDKTSPTLYTNASLVKRGRQVVVAEAEVRDNNDKLLAVTGGTFFIKQAK